MPHPEPARRHPLGRGANAVPTVASASAVGDIAAAASSTGTPASAASSADDSFDAIPPVPSMAAPARHHAVEVGPAVDFGDERARCLFAGRAS